MFEGTGQEQGEHIARLMAELGVEEWLSDLQSVAFSIIQADWAKMTEATKAGTLIFKKPAKQVGEQVGLSFHQRRPDFELWREVLSSERFILPIEWKGGMEADVAALTTPQSYFAHPLRVDYGTDGLRHLETMRKKTETSKVGEWKRVKVRMVETGLTGGAWQERALPWVDPIERKAATEWELFEQKTESDWSKELAPMQNSFNGREHLIVRTEGGMGTTAHPDNLGGWGYLSEGWKVVLTMDPVEAAEMGWSSADQLLDLAELAKVPSLKWILLGPGMSIWFTPDSFHAVITLCSSVYVTWNSTVVPHRLIYTLGLILNGMVEDYTWVATTKGKWNQSLVYADVMFRIIAGWIAWIDKCRAQREGGDRKVRSFLTALTRAARKGYSRISQDLEHLFERDGPFTPRHQEILSDEATEGIKTLYRAYRKSMRNEEEQEAERREEKQRKGGKEEAEC